MQIGRVLSVLVSLGYIAFAWPEAGPGALGMVLFLVFPLVCIWYPDELGSFTGPAIPYYNFETPGCLVAAGGWLLLLAPIIYGLIMYLLGIK